MKPGKSKKEKAIDNGYVFDVADKEQILNDRASKQISSANNVKKRRPKTKNQREYLKLLNERTGRNDKEAYFPPLISKKMLENMYYTNFTDNLYYQKIVDNFKNDFLSGWNHYVQEKVRGIIDNICDRYGVTAVGKVLDGFDYELAYFFQTSWYDSDQPYELLESFIIRNIPYIDDDDVKDLENTIDGSDWIEGYNDDVPF